MDDFSQVVRRYLDSYQLENALALATVLYHEQVGEKSQQEGGFYEHQEDVPSELPL